MVTTMPDTESRRLALYNGLNRLLGPELADTLMTYLPASEAADLATRADITRLEGEIGAVRTEVSELRTEVRGDIRHLSQRIDRLQQTTLAGFVALIAAVIAAGFLP